MALTRIKSSNIADETVVAADIADGSVTDAKIQTGVSSSKLTGNLPALNGSALTNLASANLSGALPAISGANLTGVSTDTSAIENNIAILAFKTQASNNLAKFNLIDQVIDEYYDTSGIDASASINETTGGSGVAKYYEGVGSATPTVSGNYDSTAVDGDYTYYKWTTVRSDGTFTTNQAQDYEYLVVAGGGGGASGQGGGGGAGGYRTATGFAIGAGTISGITVGAGGAGRAYGAAGNDGSNSVFSTITSTGGGGGGHVNGGNHHGRNGGSGGGGAGDGATQINGGDGVSGQGNDAGNGLHGSPYSSAGGGGAGAASVNGNTVAGASSPGGVGLANDITGSSVYYAGGGGGGGYGSIATSGAGGNGGGGAGTRGTTDATDGTANTGGGGGGGGSNSGGGGSGVVIIRRITSVESSGGNLTLQSVANTALSAPTTGDVVMLIENAQGTATLNTDIKAWVSRNGGTGWDQATLVDKGSWGTNKKIVSANNVAFSNSASGTDMRYKITTHNQSAGSKETRVHATSLAWA